MYSTIYYTITNGSNLTMYADDILLYKPISQPEDYFGLQADIDAIQDCISTNYLTMNPHKCKYLKKDTPPSASFTTPTGCHNIRGG